MSAQVPAPAPHVNAAPAIVRTACPGGGAHDVCGFVRVPLDRRLPDGRTIRIYFERRSRTERSRPPIATVLSIEGGPGLLDDRRPVGAGPALEAALRPPRPAARRPARNRPVGAARLPGVPAPHPRLHRPRRPLRCAARAGARRLRHVPVGAGPGRGAARSRHRARRPLRRFLRLVRGPGVRAPLPGQAAVARARRHLPAAGLRPGAGRPRREHAERAPAGLRAPPRVPGRSAPTRSGSSRGSSPASAAIRSSAQRRTGTARPPTSGSTRTRSSRS